MKEKLFYLLTCVNICVLVGYVIISYRSEIKSLEFLIETYNAESSIQRAQLADVLNTQNQSSAEAYNRGFENGRTQAAIGLMNKEALFDYADGYHAAFTQMGDISMPMPDIADAELEKELLEELEEDIKKLQSELNE